MTFYEEKQTHLVVLIVLLMMIELLLDDEVYYSIEVILKKAIPFIKLRFKKMCYFLLFESSYKISNILYPLKQREKFYFTGTHLSAVRLSFREKLIGVKG